MYELYEILLYTEIMVFAIYNTLQAYVQQRPIYNKKDGFRQRNVRQFLQSA